jgi:DNA-binding NarL/FixJ family response regulator
MAADRAGGLRVVVADDEYLVREGARSVLSSVDGLDVVGLAGDPDELYALVDADPPDAVVLDIRMPPTHRTEGIDAARRIRASHPGIGVVILSQYADPEYALDLLRDGSQGLAYLLKERLGDPSRLAEAIREAAAGGSVLDPKVVDALIVAQHRRSRSRLVSPCRREGDVLEMMATGRTNASIADALALTERAVEKHINAIFRKLGLSEDLDRNHRVAAVLFFLQRDVGPDPAP